MVLYTKKDLRSQLETIETLTESFDYFEYKNKAVATEILDSILEESKLITFMAVSWINSYKKSDSAVEHLESLRAELNVIEELNTVILNISVRITGYIEGFIFNKKP